MWIIIVSILIDQLSKFFACNITEKITIIPNLLSLDYVKNYGAVFGIM
ncbi:MAG: signal peptidase II [Clostridia bacterium]|nr:signal peptidase II [Clostridia bacterium]